MPAIEKGRICYLSRGRDAGTKVTVVETGDNSIVTVLKNGKKEKCNIRHLFPTKETGEIKPETKKESELNE